MESRVLYSGSHPLEKHDDDGTLILGQPIRCLRCRASFSPKDLFRRKVVSLLGQTRCPVFM